MSGRLLVLSNKARPTEEICFLESAAPFCILVCMNCRALPHLSRLPGDTPCRRILVAIGEKIDEGNNMFSERFGLSVLVTRHARERMFQRGVTEIELHDLLAKSV